MVGVNGWWVGVVGVQGWGVGGGRGPGVVGWVWVVRILGWWGPGVGG